MFPQGMSTTKMFDPTRDERFRCPFSQDYQYILKRSVNPDEIVFEGDEIVLRTVSQNRSPQEGVYSAGEKIKLLGWFTDPDEADKQYLKMVI